MGLHTKVMGVSRGSVYAATGSHIHHSNLVITSSPFDRHLLGTSNPVSRPPHFATRSPLVLWNMCIFQLLDREVVVHLVDPETMLHCSAFATCSTCWTKIWS